MTSTTVVVSSIAAVVVVVSAAVVVVVEEFRRSSAIRRASSALVVNVPVHNPDLRLSTLPPSTMQNPTTSGLVVLTVGSDAIVVGALSIVVGALSVPRVLWGVVGVVLAAVVGVTRGRVVDVLSRGTTTAPTSLPSVAGGVTALLSSVVASAPLVDVAPSVVAVDAWVTVASAAWVVDWG